MAATDWALLTGILTSGGGTVVAGATSGPTKPAGGGSFVFGVNSVGSAEGVYGRYADPAATAGIAPMAKGCDIRGAIVRATSGGTTDYSGWLFAALNDVNVAVGVAYMLGLSDGDPCHIELRKGVMSLGLPDEAPGGVHTILRRSTEVIAVDAWAHLRLEVVTNGSGGDVILNCYKSVLGGGTTVLAPSWVAIPGMAAYTDDALGVATGSVPRVGGFAGFAMHTGDTGRRVYFDHLEIAKQV